MVTQTYKTQIKMLNSIDQFETKLKKTIYKSVKKCKVLLIFSILFAFAYLLIFTHNLITSIVVVFPITIAFIFVFKDFRKEWLVNEEELTEIFNLIRKTTRIYYNRNEVYQYGFTDIVFLCGIETIATYFNTLFLIIVDILKNINIFKREIFLINSIVFTLFIIYVTILNLMTTISIISSTILLTIFSILTIIYYLKNRKIFNIVIYFEKRAGILLGFEKLINITYKILNETGEIEYYFKELLKEKYENFIKMIKLQ